MARRARNDTKDPRDWMTRANEDRALAEKMQPGPLRIEALKKAEQLREAAEMMGYLQSRNLKPPE